MPDIYNTLGRSHKSEAELSAFPAKFHSLASPGKDAYIKPVPINVVLLGVFVWCVVFKCINLHMCEQSFRVVANGMAQWQAGKEGGE